MGLVPFVLWPPSSPFQAVLLPWVLTPIFLLVAGVLLWRGHSRQYLAGVLAWGMVTVLSARVLMGAWFILERGRPLVFEQWAVPVTLLFLGLIAVAYLISAEWGSHTRAVHAAAPGLAR